MATKRTMRRVPEDVAEAQYIRKLIADDVSSRVVQLANEGKHSELAQIIGWKESWDGIVSDLTAPPEEEAPASPAPPATDAQPQTSAGSDTAEPEGGARTNRPARQRSA